MEAIALAGPLLASAGTFAASNAPLIGAGLTAAGSIYSGVRENQNAKLESKMLQKQGDDRLAQAQREALSHKREGDVALSRARAVAAAGGGGTGNDMVTKILAGIETKRDTNVLTDMYNGQQARADLYSTAAVRKREGKDALIGGILNAGASIYSGIGRNNRSNAAYQED